MVDKALYSSASGEWETPRALFDKLDAEFHFTLDPAASDLNHKCEKYYTVKEDGLSWPWDNKRVFLNPPYGRGVIEPWMRKVSRELEQHAILVVCLIHARTDTKWFQSWVLPYAHEIRFVRGRVKFVGAPSSCPFPSVVVVFRPGVRDRLECSSWSWRETR